MFWTAQTASDHARDAHARTDSTSTDRRNDRTRPGQQGVGNLFFALFPALALGAMIAVSPLASEDARADDRMSLPKETVLLEEDRLAVTVASASMDKNDPLDSEFSIWVGQIDVNDRSAIWVELIDRYGEVIYDSEVGPNETHLLPDGRAIVVRSVDPATRVAKLEESRLTSEGAMMVTRRVVEDDALGTTSVEFIETRGEQAQPQKDPGVLMHLAAFGSTVWHNIASVFAGAAERVQIAWNWLIDTLHA